MGLGDVVSMPGGLQGTGMSSAAPPNYTPADPNAYAAQQAAAPPGAPAPPPPPQGVAFPGTFQQSQGFSPDKAMQLAALGAAPARAASWQPVQRQTQTRQGVQLDPAAQASLDEEKRSYAEMQKAGADLTARQADAQAKTAGAVADWDKYDLSRKQARWDEQAQQLAQYHQKMQATLDEASKPDDPKKWWHDKNAFDKTATGIGAMLQGFVFGSTGRGESGVDWIERQIQGSMNAQRAAKDSDVKAKSEGYNLLKEHLGDEDRTHLGTEAAQRQTIISYLDAKAADQQLPAQQRFQAAQFSHQLALNQTKTLADLDEKTADQVTTSGAEHFVPGSAGGGQDLLSRLKRANDIKEQIDKLQGQGPEADKQRAALEAQLATTLSTRANTHKVRAETDALRNPGGRVTAPEAPEDTGSLGTRLRAMFGERLQGPTNDKIDEYNAQIPFALGIKSARGAALAEKYRLYAGMPDDQRKTRVAALHAAAERNLAMKKKGADLDAGAAGEE